MTDRELMQMALQNIQNSIGITKDEWKPRATIISNLLRDRLAQPEPKPIAWLSKCYNDDNEFLDYTLWDRDVGEGCFPVYTAPVHAIDISQERVDKTSKHRHEEKNCGAS